VLRLVGVVDVDQSFKAGHAPQGSDGRGSEHRFMVVPWIVESAFASGVDGACGGVDRG
jgi:hypothetical protein